mmetsp:Transcript_19384/g.33486  ORF Transcript_19384/g.33486 Transcript_19384/m.33486 type:complete len:777 (+) Transcript_19384:216-2546(+)
MHLASSSPLQVHPSSGSYKRNTSAKGSAAAVCLLPVGHKQGSKEKDYGSWLALSQSYGRGRNVASSPTASSVASGAAIVVAASQPAAMIFSGFALPATSPFSTAQTSQAQQSAAAMQTKSQGLLSQALSSSVQAHEPETSFQRQHSFFPDVDVSLLLDLQERHELFHSELVRTAYMLAAKVHKGQQRKDGSSQLSHCVMAALKLAELGLDAETVAAGFLHDALSSQPLCRGQLEEFMPSGVMQIVERVTVINEISHLYRHNKEALGEEKMRRMLLAMEDIKSVLVKLACRVHDMKTVGALPPDTQISFARETLDVFSVVANRLGVWSLKAELEDLAFAVLHPEEHARVQHAMTARQDPAALEATIARIKEQLDARGLPYEDISGRPKSLYGVWCKMEAGGITDMDKVYDVTALRVVMADKHQCYQAMRCVQEVYNCVPNRYKDYIKQEKKANGYQSLHETVYGEGGQPVEVQVRTHKMHYIAEYGFAAHWKYKEQLPAQDQWLEKEVQYKKWVATYKLGLHDRKVRFFGAPLHETALTSLGMHLLDGQGGDAPPGVDPFLRHDRFKLQAPPKQGVSVMLRTQAKCETRDLPLGFTASQLAMALNVGDLPGYELTVNSRVPAPGLLLQSGDLVQVRPSTFLTHVSLASSAGSPPALSSSLDSNDIIASSVSPISHSSVMHRVSASSLPLGSPRRSPDSARLRVLSSFSALSSPSAVAVSLRSDSVRLIGAHKRCGSASAGGAAAVVPSAHSPPLMHMNSIPRAVRPPRRCAEAPIVC